MDMKELAKCAAWMRWTGTLAVATLATGCDIESSPLAPVDTSPRAIDASGAPPRPLALPPPLPPEYRRTSMAPLYQLTPQSELGRFDIFGVRMAAADFQVPFTIISVEQKLSELEAQIGFERGGGPVDLFIDEENRTRASSIPFRGNPSDVKLMELDGVPKAFVPLGGGISDPGNEVAIVDLDNGNIQRVRVGIHPQRVFAHQASGLVFVCNQYSNYVSIINAPSS
jgi:hypothetical protein